MVNTYSDGLTIRTRSQKLLVYIRNPTFSYRVFTQQWYCL